MRRSPDRRGPLDADGERQAVRLLCLITVLIFMVVAVVLLGVGAYLPAAGCAALVVLAGSFARSLYVDLHQEQLARDARASATRAVADPFEGQ